MTYPLGAQAGYRRTPLSAEERGPGEANFAVACYRETGTSCQRPPLRLRLLPLAWPGALSPM